MVSVSSYSYDSTNSALTAQQSALSSTADSTSSSADSADAGSPAARDTLNLSPQAQAALSKQSAATKPFADVTADARATLDAGYAKLKAEGQTIGDYLNKYGRPTSSWYLGENLTPLFGSLDRRSLFAVASNSEGKFTQEEQSYAQDFMSWQTGTTMGEGLRLQDGEAAPGIVPGSFDYVFDPAPGYLAGIKFLDSVSPEEKASAGWMLQRAILQNGYEHVVLPKDGPPQNVASGNPIVDMLVNALKSMTPSDPGVGGTYIKSFDDLKNLPLLKKGNNASELQRAIEQQQAIQKKQHASRHSQIIDRSVPQTQSQTAVDKSA